MSLDFTVGKLLAREREARFVPAAERNAESCGFRVPGSRQGWAFRVPGFLSVSRAYGFKDFGVLALWPDDWK